MASKCCWLLVRAVASSVSLSSRWDCSSTGPATSIASSQAKKRLIFNGARGSLAKRLARTARADSSMVAAQQGGVAVIVQSGVKTQIATHDRFDKQCRPSRVEISVLAPPANGTVTTEPKDLVICLLYTS